MNSNFIPHEFLKKEFFDKDKELLTKKLWEEVDIISNSNVNLEKIVKILEFLLVLDEKEFKSNIDAIFNLIKSWLEIHSRNWPISYTFSDINYLLSSPILSELVNYISDKNWTIIFVFYKWVLQHNKSGFCFQILKLEKILLSKSLLKEKIINFYLENKELWNLRLNERIDNDLYQLISKEIIL